MKVPTVPAMEDLEEDSAIRHLMLRHQSSLAGLHWPGAPKQQAAIIAEAKDPKGRRYKFSAERGIWDRYHGSLHKTGTPTHEHLEPEYGDDSDDV